MATTTLWPTGATGHPYGDFTGKAAAAPETATRRIPRQSYSAIYRRTMRGRHAWLLVFLHWWRG